MANRMKNQGVWIGLVIAGMISLMILGACSKKQEMPEAGKAQVTTMTIKALNIPVALEYVAQTASSRMVNINARVNGFLEKRFYQEGAMVKEGQTLFQIDPRPFQVQVNQAKAALDSSKAAHATAKSNLNRIKPLVRLNALSKKDLDNATGQFLTTQAAVHQAQAQLATAKLNLSYTTIKSPLNGLSGSALVANGTYVDATNSKLTAVYQLSPMWVNFSISENQLLDLQKQIQTGQLKVPADNQYMVEVILADGSVFPNQGRLIFSAPNFNPMTGTNVVRASVDNARGALRPNQYVRVRLLGGERLNAISVPQKAVQQGSKGHFVWVIRDGKAQYRPVLVGDWNGSNWTILQGLQEGEQLVVDGVQSLKAGADVIVTKNTGQEATMASVAPAVLSEEDEVTNDKTVSRRVVHIEQDMNTISKAKETEAANSAKQ